jgi:uncharacterized protein (DUF58 family)
MLLAFALTVVPTSLAPLFTPTGNTMFAGAVLLFCCIAAVDAVAVVQGLKGLSVSFPERLNLVRNRESALEIRIADAKNRPLSLRVGIVLPDGVASPVNTLPVLLPGGGDGLDVSWPLTGFRRGVLAIERCRVRMPSPLGLWFGQSAMAVATAVHVYPGLQNERKTLSALLAHRNDMRVRPHRQIGQGREFEKLRNYLPGDSQADIHWKATARRGHPVTKEFRIERTQEVYCIIDASRLSARRTGYGRDCGQRDTFLDVFLSASLLLATIAQRQGDLFGVMAFSDQPLTFIRAKSGMDHFGVCREALSTVHASLVTPNFEETASFLATRLRRRALLLFLTSLDESALAESFVRSVPVLSRRHLVQVHAMQPAAASPLFSDDGTEIPDDLYERLGGHFVWHGLRQARENLKLRGVDISLSDRERFCASLVTRYLNVKRRQIL